MKLASIIDALNVVDGMTILDIGAGPGYASFLFAEKLQGSGKVFATDIRADFVDYISKEAQRRGLNNLTAAKVAEVGLDEFYGKHRYDLVLLSNVYHCIQGRIEYFTDLRRYLNKNARLVLVMSNQVPLFSADDFLKIDDLAKALAAEGEDSPFVKNLSASTRHLLEVRDDEVALKNALGEDFNRMVSNPVFYRNFYSDSYFRKDFFTAQERDFANWLLMSLEEDGVLEKPTSQIGAKAMRTVIKLNRLFVMKQFGDCLANGGMGAYLPVGDANRHTSKYVMLRELEAAGYQYVEEMTLSPYYDVVVMSPKAP